MPLPLIPLIGIGFAVALGGYGVKKGVDAYSDNEEADDINEKAKELLREAEQSLKSKQSACQEQFEDLGRLKFSVWADTLGRFVSLYEQLRGVDLTGIATKDKIDFSPQELKEMKELSGYASEVVGGGVMAVGSGALVGMASYGGAVMFASASTGTAISSLAGAAATNATLAWLGGGSLAAGGLGMAGGVAALTTIAAGPVLAVAGGVMAAKARENLAKARSNRALATEQEAEMDEAGAEAKAKYGVAKQRQDVIKRLDKRMTSVLDDLVIVIARNGHDVRQYPESARQTVDLSKQFAQCLKAVLDAPILTKEGAIVVGHQEVLDRAEELLKRAGHSRN